MDESEVMLHCMLLERELKRKMPFIETKTIIFNEQDHVHCSISYRDSELQNKLIKDLPNIDKERIIWNTTGSIGIHNSVAYIDGQEPPNMLAGVITVSLAGKEKLPETLVGDIDIETEACVLSRVHFYDSGLPMIGLHISCKPFSHKEVVELINNTNYLSRKVAFGLKED